MILRGGERQRGLAVGKAEEAGFFAVEEGLHHHFGASCTESAVETVVDRGKRFRFRHSHGYALAGSKPVRLDDDRRTLCTNIVLGRFGGLETLVSAGRNIVARTEILGEALGAFKLGRRFRRSEGGDAGGTQIIRQTRNQRRFRADDNEVDCLFFRKGDDGRVVFHIKRNECRVVGDAGISRGGIKFFKQGRLGNFPRQRMFASAGTDQQNFHGQYPCKFASNLVSGALRAGGRKVKEKAPQMPVFPLK
ncbi:hypothetical protein D3C86_1423130 [compost metagenome]